MATMRGLGTNRGRHLSDSCDPMAGPQEPLCPLAPDTQGSFLLSPALSHYATLDPSLHHLTPTSPTSLQPEYLLSLNSQLPSSATLPRLHLGGPLEQVDYTQGCLAQAGGRAGTLSTSMSMGLGLGLGGAPLITSGTATISSAAAAKMNRLPATLLDQLERHLPMQADGFSTLQFHRRSRTARQQRGESPGRIRHLVTSVQKLFAKSQSLEGEGAKAAARRSKSKDRGSEGAKRGRARPHISGFWSSDDGLDEDVAVATAEAAAAAASPPSGTVAVAYRNPLSMMTLGRAVSDSQAPPRFHPQGYNTISTHSDLARHTLKPSKSSGDLKSQTPGLRIGGGEVGVGGGGRGGGGGGGGRGDMLVKRGSWSTLTLSHARQVIQKGSATVNRTLLKSKSCHQDMACHYLQVPLGDWAGTVDRGRRPGEIPCRRMRSGSYVKAMGDTEDSEESDGSPKPSPKSAARRQSYLKATQHSLSEQQPVPPPRNCLPSLREISTNRSLDNLDCLMGQADVSLHPWEAEGSFSLGCASLARGSGINQVDSVCKYEQCFVGMGGYSETDSQAVEALDLPMATCFRSRSHSYLRAIQAGCSQDDDTASVDSDEPQPAASTQHTYSSSTVSTCTSTCKKNPPPVPPRTTSKPFISAAAQSSTESAQDIYLDGADPRSEANSQSGRSNSSDSLTSSRTDSLAKVAKVTKAPQAPQPPLPAPAPAEPPPPAASSELSDEVVTLGVPAQEPQTEPATKRKLSSIGIQVDCIQPVPREEAPSVIRFQSIGVQVEDGRPLSRFTSMASRQETTETESQDQTEGKASDGSSVPPQTEPSADPAADSTHAGAELSAAGGTGPAPAPAPEALDPALDPSSLPPPDPSLDAGGVNGEQGSGGAGAAAHLRDGRWFLELLRAETGRMEAWCQQMEQDTKDKQLSEEVLGKIRSAVGSAQLIISQKFQQFRGLCEENLNVEANPRPTAQDLAGFWDLLQLSIEDISMKFEELHQLRANAWKPTETPAKKEEIRQPPPTLAKKPIKSKSTGGRDKGGDSAAEKQRQEARKRLMAAKRAVSERQNSATESADSIEIYVPEAQTRL